MEIRQVLYRSVLLGGVVLLVGCGNVARSLKIPMIDHVPAPIHHPTASALRVELQGLSSADIGKGSAYDYYIRYSKILPWMRARAATLQKLPCQLKRPATIRLALQKMYLHEDSGWYAANVTVSVLYPDGKKHYYAATSNDDGGYWGFSTESQVKLRRHALNKALLGTFKKVKVDICRRLGR